MDADGKERARFCFRSDSGGTRRRDVLERKRTRTHVESQSKASEKSENVPSMLVLMFRLNVTHM